MNAVLTWPRFGVLIMSRPTFTCCHPVRPVPSRACGCAVCGRAAL